ncbi:MAG: Sir2 family NAD-dependent protein deacetylase [Actinomycetota bacterium]|nr:Sir2 family NAD-dependent protein deacetylase [Actinomycetota bacterium]
MTAVVDEAEGVARLASMLESAERVLVFTGAGISTASGIPDYRGPDGVWNTRRPVFYDEFMSRHDARGEYWRQKAEDREAFASARPNAVHRSIVELQRAGRIELVVTQNVDGLHRVAGTAAGLLVEVHGTNALIECQTCGERSEPDAHFASFAETGEPPLCVCGGYLKSATISFGQQLRAVDLARAFDAAKRADVAIALGSTLSVTPAADVPMEAARHGAAYAVINRGATEHDRSPFVALRIGGDVGAVFPAAVARALAQGAVDR